MTTQRPAQLLSQFLVEPDISKRVEMTLGAVNGRTPDEAVSVLFMALSCAVDQLRVVTEITIASGVSGDTLFEELGRYNELRSADYTHYQFQKIVEGLGEGTVTS